MVHIIGAFFSKKIIWYKTFVQEPFSRLRLVDKKIVGRKKEGGGDRRNEKRREHDLRKEEMNYKYFRENLPAIFLFITSYSHFHVYSFAYLLNYIPIYRWQPKKILVYQNKICPNPEKKKQKKTQCLYIQFTM